MEAFSDWWLNHHAPYIAARQGRFLARYSVNLALPDEGSLPAGTGVESDWDGLDVPFVFANTDLCDQATGGGARPRTLSSVMAATWARFARTGNPNGGKLPHWPVFTPKNSAAMIFDDRSHVVLDPDPAFRKALGTT